MRSEPVAAQAAAAAVPGPRAGAHDFAATLRARQVDAAQLETVTLGEMLGRPSAITVVGAEHVAEPSLTPQAPGTALRWPVRGRATSEFGPRTHPITGARRAHDGLDIAAPAGTPIVSAAAGRVTFAGRRGGYGNVVIIDHGGGMHTRYAHQETVAVTVGQTVRAGQRIGAVGSTGMSTGPHLHFEVRRHGTAIDPRTVLP